MREVRVSVDSSIDKAQSKLNQIGQTKNVTFALVAESEPDTFFLFHPLCKCRDYLSDVLHCKHFDESFQIYGMHVSAQDNKLNVDRLQLLIAFPSSSMCTQFIKNFDFVNRKGKELVNGPECELCTVEGSSTRVMILGDKFWQSKTYLLSLYTLLCRLAVYLDSPEQDWDDLLRMSGNDINYLKYLKDANLFKFAPALREIDPKNKNGPAGWPPMTDTSYVHNYSGILSAFKAGEYEYLGDSETSRDFKKFHKLIAK